MQLTAHQIGVILDGVVDGNPEVAVSKLAKIEEADEGSLSFFANSRYEPYVYTSNASVIIVDEDFIPSQHVPATMIRVKNAYSAFSVLLEKYDEMLKADKAGVETPSFIHPSAKIGKNVYIGAFAYIGSGVTVGDNCKLYPGVYLADNVTIGSNTILYAGVKIYFNCKLGINCIIHSGAIIGADGFGFVPDEKGNYKKISQIGNVIIEDDVEIGSNTTVDRATMGSTIIRKGVKLDNLIQIGHNVEIGVNTVIAAQTGVSGSTKIGENCVIGGQVGISGHITIANGSNINGRSGVNSSITEENKAWAGMPLMPFRDSLKAQVATKRLPELEKKVLELEKLVNELKSG